MGTIMKLRERYSYSFILLRQLVKTDFKLRYQGSVLGYVWSLLRPLLIFAILYFVFTEFLPVGKNVEHYPVYLLLGIVLWNYFTEVTSGSVGAIVGKGDLLRKINFPKYVVILAGSMSALINLGLNAVIIGIFMFFNGIELSWNALIILPLLLELFILALACDFFLSALFVRFRDVSYIWEVLMQGAFYATPIIYPLTVILDDHPRLAKILILNPMAQIIQDSRYVLVTKESAIISKLYPGKLGIWLLPIGLTVLVAIVSAIYFRKRSRYFAEEV